LYTHYKYLSSVFEVAVEFFRSHQKEHSFNQEHDWLTIAQIDKEISRRGKIARLQAYIYAIISANPEAAEEAIKMGSKFPSENYLRALQNLK
jgi:hypothetical protein